MQQVKALFIVLFALFGFAAHADNAAAEADSMDKVIEDLAAGINEMNTILVKITDTASAELAKPELKALSNKMQGIKVRMESFEATMTVEDKKAFSGKMMGSVMGPAMAMMGEMKRIEKIEGVKESLEESMKAMR